MTHAQISAAGLTAIAMGGAGLLAYGALWPQSQIFGPTVVASRRTEEIAMTYDDGPNDIYTERLLEVLARHGTRASFFLIGAFVRKRPHLARAIAAAGHVIGNHTMTHPWLAWQSAQRIREELVGCNAAIEDAIGCKVRYFRAPHGARRPEVLRIACELGLTPVQWNIIPGDWMRIPAETIAVRVDRGIARNQRRGWASNIVLHDGGQGGLGQPRGATVEASELLLRRYAAGSGMKFVTVDSWTDIFVHASSTDLPVR